MKGKRALQVWAVLALLVSLGIGVGGATSAMDELGLEGPASTGFTYQGQLRDGSGPVNATCDLEFSLWDAQEGGAQVGGTVLLEDVVLADGLFTAQLDFGAAAFRGQARYLEVAASCPVGSAFVPLPRQELTGSPYALWALGAPWTGLVGVPADLADGDQNTTYTPGAGLVLEGTEFRVNRGEVQWRVSETCAAGSSIRAIDVNGAVTCEVDDNTTYTPGTGLSLVSGQFSVNFGGSGTEVTASRSDHNHDAAYVNEGQANSVSTGMVQNSTLLLEDLNQNGCGTGQVIKWTGSAWACAPDQTAAGSYWSLTGNAGTAPGTNYLGTTDNLALELKVNGVRVLRLEPGSSPNLLGGYSGNLLTAGVIGATVSGGGSSGNANRATDSWGTVGGGTNNRAGDNAGTVDDARFATVGGGFGNAAGKDSATVGGGYYNSVIGVFGTVGGGEQNDANGERSTVAGGSSNEAIGAYASVGGGLDNSASGEYATVSGGRDNTASSSEATVGGGSGNTASGGFGVTVSGGDENFAGSVYATIGGGAINEITYGEANTIGGGIGNRIDGRFATIAGGSNNIASGMNATIGGGGAANTLFSNHATGDYATIGGGVSNFATAERATIGGGGNTVSTDPDSGNLVSDSFGTVGGGGNNQAGDDAGTTEDHPFATVSGGRDNTASGTSSVVAGGDTNTASGWRSTVPGGVGNVAAGDHSFAAGRRAKANHGGAFVWADGLDVDFASTNSNTFRVRATNGAEFVANNAGYGLIAANNGAGDGLRAMTNSSAGSNWAAVYAVNNGTSPAVYANSAGTYSGYFLDDIYVDGNCVGCTTAFVAVNAGSRSLEAGDLVSVLGVTDPLTGTAGPLLTVQMASAQGPGVIGVVQSKATLSMSERGRQALQSAEKAGGRAARGEYLFIVVQGIAYVKADARLGAINPGDRLTAAAAPGHARSMKTVMVEGVALSEGAPVVGIALEALAEGTGLIPVLVSLR